MGGSTSKSSEELLSSEKAAEIKELTSSNCVVIFSKSHCPYCRMAKRVFAEINVQPTVVEINQRNDCSEMQDILAAMTGERTVSTCTLFCFMFYHCLFSAIRML